MQGVAEVVPVSSSAQLTLLPWLLGWPEVGPILPAALHAGSCLGMAWALRAELAALSRKDLGVLAATSAPAALAGWLLPDRVNARLGGPARLAALLAGAGGLLWLADRRPQNQRLRPSAVLAAATAQVAALLPGVSRSGATLTALRALRVPRADAARFTLLMSLPITAGAAALTVARADRRQLVELRGPLAAGVPIAALAAAAATSATARRGASIGPSAAYRLLLAAAVAGRLARRG